ncbi:MAG: diguanylate cyclase [Candidatus Thiodiazotropha sp.]|jgi:diguanylate cyclase (GGDEF)-like protein
MKATIQTKLFLSHFAAIILVSGSVGSYFYHSATESLMISLQSRLKNSAALVSQGLETDSLDQIRSAEDIEHPSYQKNIAMLHGFVKSNPDIAFIYVMRKLGNKAVFVLDSDIQQTALPGEQYKPDLPKMMEGFLRPSVDDEITHDRWGYFLSGYSPLLVGEDDYLVGVDMRANEVQNKFQQIRMAGILSLALSIILAMIFSRWLSINLTQRIKMLATRFAQIAPLEQGKSELAQGDELDQLAASFDQMFQRLEIKNQQVDVSQAALQKARDELELRVETRTTELVEINEKLLAEIVERKHVERMLEETSRIDFLTGILNRRAISKRLEQMVSQTERSSLYFCIILLDLDNFKRINDNHGHDVGDQVLKHAVAQLRKRIREADELGRWGGEEFLIMLPDTQLSEAATLAQRLCEDLSDTHMFLPGGQITVTASFGVALFRPGELLDICLKRADDALFAAKDKGRNCVVVSETLSNTEISKI